MTTLWVVEMLNTAYRARPPRYEPTVGAALTKQDGTKALQAWRKNNPDDKFRLVAYVRRRG